MRLRKLAFLLFCGCLTECVAQYAGPSMLSRGGNQPGRRGRAPIDFTVYGSARGIYESGLITQTNEEGELVAVDQTGVQFEGGVYGGHNWRRTSLGLDYRGDYRRSSRQGTLNGTNQALELLLQHRFGRRLQLLLQQTAGTTNRAFGAFAAPVFGDVFHPGVPVNEVFDVRMHYLQSAVSAVWQKSARVDLAVGGDLFFVKRKSLSLINTQGASFYAAANYRLDRATTVGVLYRYSQFEYPRLLTKLGVNSPSLVLRRQFGRNIVLEGSAGAALVNSAGTETVRLSPEVAAILGRPTGQAFYERTRLGPQYDVRFSYTQERGRLSVSYGKGIAPGNGLFRGVDQQQAFIGYSYTGIRRMALGLSGGWAKSNSLSIDLPDLTSWRGGGGFSYRVFSGTSIVSQLDYRSFDTTARSVARTGYMATFGLAFTSSRLPLSIW